MQKVFLSFSALAIALVLVGAGCSDDGVSSDDFPTKNTDQAYMADQLGDDMANATPKTTNAINTATDFTLSAKAVGDGTVEFSWNAPAHVTEDIDKFMIVRGEEPNPTHPASWWWWRGPSYNDLTWEGLPEGEAHFRVCTVKDDECMAYSNDVLVDVR